MPRINPKNKVKKKKNGNNKEMHSTKQRIDAVYNEKEYINQRLAIPDNKSQVFNAILTYTSWPEFFQHKILPKPGDWLYQYPEEKRGQTFNSWYKLIKKSSPIYQFLTNGNKNSIGLVTCGKFDIYLTDKLYPLFDILSQFTKVYFFGLNVSILKSISIDQVKSRYNSSSKNKQLKTGSIQTHLKKLKKDHKTLCCLMGISIIDLYPDESWNFVFGEASIQESVGVFSFARYLPGFDIIAGWGNLFDNQDLENKDYDPMIKINKLENLKQMINGDITTNNKNWLNNILNDKEQMIFIRRCIGVLLHEIGHLFGLEHCPYFECLMNGANHLIEGDAAPLWLCPICLHKVYFATRLMEKNQWKSKAKGEMKKKNDDQDEEEKKQEIDIDDKTEEKVQFLDILTRYQRLSALYKKYGLMDEANWCQKRATFIFESCTLKNDNNLQV